MQFILRGAVHATPFHSFRAPACTLLQVGTGLTDNQKNDGSSRLPLAGVTPAQVAVQVFQPCWVPCDRLVGPMQGWQAPGQQWMATVYQPDARASSGVFETQECSPRPVSEQLGLHTIEVPAETQMMIVSNVPLEMKAGVVSAVPQVPQNMGSAPEEERAEGSAEGTQSHAEPRHSCRVAQAALAPAITAKPKTRTGASRRALRRQRIAEARETKDLHASSMAELVLNDAASTTTCGGESLESLDRLESIAESQTCQDTEEPKAPFVEPREKVSMSAVVGSVWPLSRTSDGCLDIQKLLDDATGIEKLALAQELRGHVLEAIKSPNANFVVQKCVEVLPADSVNFFAEELRGHASAMARHRSGCRVLNRLIEHCPTLQTFDLVDEVLCDADTLVRHKFGNFVLQHLLEHGTSIQRRRLVDLLVLDAVELSKHRHASHLVQKALIHCSADDRQRLVDVIAEDLKAVSHTQYGSFVAREIQLRC